MVRPSLPDRSRPRSGPIPTGSSPCRSLAALSAALLTATQTKLFNLRVVLNACVVVSAEQAPCPSLEGFAARPAGLCRHSRRLWCGRSMLETLLRTASAMDWTST